MATNWKQAATMGLEVSVNILTSYVEFLEEVLNGPHAVDLPLKDMARQRAIKWAPVLTNMEVQLTKLKGDKPCQTSQCAQTKPAR